MSAAFGGDEGDPPPADVVVWGPVRDCLAHRYVRVSAALRRLWTLTPRRLALHTEDAEPGGFLAKAASGLAKLGRELAEKHRLRFGANVEDEPVALPVLEPVSEIPRSQMAGFEVAHRGSTPVLRLRLVDGSGVDFLVGMTDRDEYEYAAGLAGGEPPLRPGVRAEWVAKLAEKSRELAGRLVGPGRAGPAGRHDQLRLCGCPAGSGAAGAACPARADAGAQRHEPALAAPGGDLPGPERLAGRPDDRVLGAGRPCGTATPWRWPTCWPTPGVWRGWCSRVPAW